jgi:AbrB family looped-hinge helix DNA binding protein
MPEATLTSKGQVTIPKRVREHLRLSTGDRVDFVVTDQGDVLLRPARRDIRELRGLLRKPAKAATTEQMDSAIARHLSRKHRRASSP